MLTAHPSELPPVEYRLIAGKPGYRVGDDGSVWSRMAGGRHARVGETWYRMNPTPLKSGHLQVALGGGCREYVHRLVLESFVGPCPAGLLCRHLDGKPSNNRLGNLRWGTNRENWDDSVSHGTAYLAPGKRLGEDSPCAKIDTAMVLRIMEHARAGMKPTAICREVGLPKEMYGTVLGVVRGQSWNHVTGLRKYVPRSGRASEPSPVKSPVAATSDNKNVPARTQLLMW